MTAAAHARGRAPGRASVRVRGRAGRRSRRLAGVLVVVMCALVPAEAWVRAGMREPVLALARPVTAGQVITGPDLRVVRVSAAGPVSVVPVSRRDQVTGRTAAAGLPAGSLLAPGDIGAPSPGGGQARLGVALAPGRYPPDLSPGQHVDILVPGRCAGNARLAGQGVVLAVTAPAAGQAVAELQVRQDAVPLIAAAGQVSLAAIPAGR
jgi:hypothetical protein